MEANPLALPLGCPRMPIDVLHSVIGFSFLAIWMMIGQFLMADKV
jgi:hypothetical protein